MRNTRIGIVGAGGIVAQRHLPGLRAIPGVEVAAIANRSPKSARRFCGTHSLEATVFDDWKDLLEADIDAVLIGTTPYMHREITCAALESGKHVFCQARMAMNVAEAEAMLAASCKHPDLVAMLCPPPMGMRADLLMKRLLADGAIGEPHEVHLRSQSAAYLDPTEAAHWRQRKEISGVQVMTFGIYVEVLHRWFGNIAAVTSHAKTVHAERDGCKIEIPDVLNVLCTFASGVEGTLRFSGVAGGAPGDLLEVYGSEGSLRYDFTDETIALWTPAVPEWRPVDLLDDLSQDWTVESDFVHAVRNPNTPRPQPDFDAGLAYMRVVEAAATARESATKVVIPEHQA